MIDLTLVNSIFEVALNNFFLFNYEYFQDEQKLLTIKYNEVTLKIFMKQKVGVVKYCRAV